MKSKSLTLSLRDRAVRTEISVLTVLLVFVTAVAVAPLSRLLFEGIAPSGVFDWGRIQRIFNQASVWRAAVNTLIMATGSAALATLIGALLAAAVAVTDIRTKASLVFCVILPLMIPPQVATLAWINLFGSSSTLLSMLGLAAEAGTRHPLYSLEGIIIVLGLHNAPLVFLAVRASLRALPSDLVEAARSEGASPLRAFLSIVLPLARSGLISGAALAFVSAAGNFAVPAMLGIPGRVPTLITLIYQRLSDYGQEAFADVALLSLSLGAIAVSGLLFQSWLLRRRDIRITSLTATPLRFSLGPWRRPTEIACWVFALGVLVLPLLALLSTALVSGYGQALTTETATLKNFTNALFHHTMIRGAFMTSAWLAAATAVILTIVGIPLAYFIVWRPNSLVRVASAVLEVGYALPGTLVALAAILLLIKPIPIIQVSLYGTPWIILLAYLTNRSVLSLRPIVSGFMQLDRSLEEAARVVGAGFFRRLRDIIIPLVAPAAGAGAILVFLTVLTEIQVSVLLVTSSTRTIGASVYFLEESGATTLAAAVGVLIVVAVFCLMLFVSSFKDRLPKGILPWAE
ncbi:ABC transporter permease [Microvirga rosea]|uniref:ABC transporter permease n=1 Tax=Microvirga rosea TaxID=2715425 RepID=UPI001D0B9B31|nr:iron ABC transporter permease [Microvirga rosea]MCB8823509.1 iron ABC transporter permease [Microvirga rosea]